MQYTQTKIASTLIFSLEFIKTTLENRDADLLKRERHYGPALEKEEDHTDASDNSPKQSVDRDDSGSTEEGQTEKKIDSGTALSKIDQNQSDSELKAQLERISFELLDIGIHYGTKSAD